MKRFVQLCQEIADSQRKIFDIEGIKVSVKFEELLNDMKTLAMLAFELSNSAKFFSSTNVSKENCSILERTFGTNGNTTWCPWVYKERVAVANLVDKFKLSLPRKYLPEKQFHT